MSLQPGSSYVNYLAVKKLLPLDDYANPYPSTTIFAVDSSGTLAGYSPGDWFSTIGILNPSTLQAEFISTVAVINAGFGSTTYGLVSTMNIVNKDVLTSSLTSTVAGLTTTTGVSQAQFDAAINGLGTTGYVSSTQLASTVAGLGTAGYLSTGAGGLFSVRAISTGSVSLSTLALVDTTNSASVKLLYNQSGGLYFGASLIGGTITDLSLNTLDVSNATVYQDLDVGGSVYVSNGSITAPITYSNTISTTIINAQKDAIPRLWGVAGTFPDSTYGVQYSSDGGNTWDVSASLFSGAINNLVYLNGIWFALGYNGILGGGFTGLYYSTDNGINWTPLSTFNNTYINDIAYNGSFYIAVGTDFSSTNAWRSTDGITWSPISTVPPYVELRTIIYNGTYWVAGGSSNTILYSPDGITWSTASGTSSPPSVTFTKLFYNGHITIAISDGTITNNIYYSADKGLSWATASISGSSLSVLSVSWNGTVFVASTAAPSIYTSRDGITWTFRYTPSEQITTLFWNGRIFKGAGTTQAYESTDGYTWSQTPKTYTVASPTAISYSVYVGDDLITTNARYYGVDVPHYYDSTNQIYAGPDRLVLNNTLTIKDGLVGVMKGDPGVHLDVEGAARASTLMVSTIQLADPLGQTVVYGRGGMMYINDIPIVQSTVAGLGTIGYISSQSLISTINNLGTFPGYVSSSSLTSTVDNLGTIGYVSSQSLISTINNLGTFPGYVSSASLTSTVGSLLTNLRVSSFSASTIGYAKLFTSTVYIGNDNTSTNLIRFYGTSGDGGAASDIGRYGHTVIAERIYSTIQSELLLFKGNDGAYPTDVDRIRHLAGTHQFDIISRSDTTTIWYDGSGNPPQPDISAALFIGANGFVGIGTNTPQRAIHVRPPAENGVIRLDRVTGSGPAYHLHYFDSSDLTTPWKGFSMSIIDSSGANTGKFSIGDLQQNVAGFTALPRLTIDTSGSVGIGTSAPSYSLDVSGSFYASTINYAKLYTSTIYVGNDNNSTNMIRFYGTNKDGPGQDTRPYSHTVIAERIYEVDENSELLLFKGNDAAPNFYDRIRHLAPIHQFDILPTSSEWPDTSGNPPEPSISGALFINNNGAVGINTTNPTITLDISGDLRVSGTPFNPGGTGSWTTTSDQRVKTDIHYINTESCLTSIRALPLKSYTYSADYRSYLGNLPEKHYKGFIAQEVEKIFPNAVQQRNEFGYDDFRTLDYHEIHMAHYGATQHIADILDIQQSTIKGQGAEIAELRTFIQQHLKK